MHAATRPTRADDAIFTAPLAYCDYGVPVGVAHRLRPFMTAMRAEGADMVRRVQALPPMLCEDFARKNGAGREAARAPHWPASSGHASPGLSAGRSAGARPIGRARR